MAPTNNRSINSYNIASELILKKEYEKANP